MSDADAEVPKLIAVADGIHVRQEVDNIAWLDMGDHLLVVDALEQPELKDEVFDAIASTAPGKPVRYVLNTHTHYDHVALNDAFRRRWGAEIISHAATPLQPEGRQFAGERRTVRMIPMPGCHTDEDCIVWAPEDKVLFVGDIFGWGLIPLTVNLRRESRDLLLDTYQRLIDLAPAVVVPGHGPICTDNELQRWVDYFLWLEKTISEACAAGETDAEIVARVEPPADMRNWWRFLKWKHDDTVAKIIKACRKGWVGPSNGE